MGSNGRYTCLSVELQTISSGTFENLRFFCNAFRQGVDVFPQEEKLYYKILSLIFPNFISISTKVNTTTHAAYSGDDVELPDL
jgi:hypothetical protein